MESTVKELLDTIQANMFNQASEFMNNNIVNISTYEDFKKQINDGGFVRCGWDGTEKTEQIIKEETKATIRCIPFDEDPSDISCILTGSPAKHEVIFAKAY